MTSDCLPHVDDEAGEQVTRLDLAVDDAAVSATLASSVATFARARSQERRVHRLNDLMPQRRG